MTRTTTIRRAAAALAVTLGLMASAGAAGAAEQSALNASAHSQALKISLTLPTSDELRATLKDIGVDPSVVPDAIKFAGQTLVIDVAVNDGQITLSGAKGFAKTYGLALGGTIKADAKSMAESSCSSATECDGENKVAAASITLPADLGVIELLGARSAATEKTDSRNQTYMVRVKLDLQGLFAGPLAGAKSTIDSLTNTVNTTVLPPVNQVIDTVSKALPVKDPDITVGPIKAIPSITSVPLLDLTVMPGQADTFIDASGATKLLTAESTAGIKDLRILGDWVTAGYLNAKAKAWGDSRFLEAFSDLDLQRAKITQVYKSDRAAGVALAKQVAAARNADLADALGTLKAKALGGLDSPGISLAGLLSVDLSEKVRQFKGLENLLRQDVTANPALKPVMDEVFTLARIFDNVSGFSVEEIAGNPGTVKQFGKPSKVSVAETTRNGRPELNVKSNDPAPLGYAAEADSGSYAINLAPAIPVLTKGLTPEPVRYVSSGIALRVEMPRAVAAVGRTATVQGVLVARTGIGTPWVLAIVLIGAAIAVRRFAFVK